MITTYYRLKVRVDANTREVLRAARKKLRKGVRTGRKYREGRHEFYREMLRYHQAERASYLRYRF